MLSAGASGQKGKTLTYRQTKYGKILTPYVKPSQPNSPDQITWRNNFIQSKDEWDGLSPHLKQVWRSSAISRRYKYAGYPMWMKYRIQDIKDRLSWNAYSIKLDWKYLPVQPGLVLWAQMEKGSGDTVYDFTRTNPGTIHGATWELINDQIYGLSFDGSNDYVDCGNDESLNITNEVTVEAWFYAPDISSEGYIVSKNNKDSEDYLGLFIYNKKIYIPSSTYASTTQVLSPNTCQHVAAVRYETAGTPHVDFYLNGVKQTAKADVSASLEASTYKLGIGARNPDSLSHYFNGIIDEVRIYNRALSEAEILHNYNLLKNILQV